MASAAFASMNESGWAHVGKVSSYPNSNPSSNNNPKKKQKKVHPSTPADGRYNHANGDLPADTQTASDDAYSFNQTSTSRNAGNYGGYLVFNVASYTKSELVELRRRLCSELDQIRDLRDQIESGQISTVENPRSFPKSKKANGNKRPFSSSGSFFDNPLRDGFDSAVDVDPLVFEGLLKECGKIAAKLIKHKHGYVFKTPVDAAAMGLHDYHLIVKRPMDLGTVKSNLGKNMYPTPIEFAEDVRLTFNNALLYNPKHDPVSGMAEQLLLKFEELFKPIQEKFDAMVRQIREEKELRERELREFRAISEHNDLQGSSWNNNGVSSNLHKKHKPKVKSSPIIPPLAATNPERVHAPAMQAHSSASTPSNPPLATITQQQDMIVETFPPNLPVKDQKSGRGGTVKQPKPRAKDPNKREMSMEEKQKLGLGLQNLPQEKMPQLLQIIRKRNEHLAQDGDEIELDIEALDTETLWELDRFVTNWKKMVSKTKRQALMMNGNVDQSGVTTPANPVSEAYVGSENNEDDALKKSKENDDEDVDIDDDMPETSFPPVEIEKDEGQGIGGIVTDDKGHDEPDDERNHPHDEPHQDNNDNNGRGNASSSSSSSGSSSSGSSSSSGINAELTSLNLSSVRSNSLPQRQCCSTECSFVRALRTDSDSGSSSGSDSDADDAQS